MHLTSFRAYATCCQEISLKNLFHNGNIIRASRRCGTCPAKYHPRAPAGATSIGAGPTAPLTRFLTSSVARSARGHTVVDNMGLPPAVLVTSASVEDAATARTMFARLAGRPMLKVVRMYADSKYPSFKLYEWVNENARFDKEIIHRPDGAGAGRSCRSGGRSSGRSHGWIVTAA